MQKYKKLIYIIIIMFSFLNSTNAKYEKIFYDFQINDINDEILDLSKFEGKTILLVTHDPAEAARLGESILVLSMNGIKDVCPPEGGIIRAYDEHTVLACQGQLLRLLRAEA